jgi:REP element-mobilizing transposase RayT
MDKERIRQKAKKSFKADSGWSSRGYIPHYDAAGITQFITMRLADSVPQHVQLQLKAELEALEASGVGPQVLGQERRKRIERLLDAGYGSCVLANEAVAQVVIQSLETLKAAGHELTRWVIMPNHIHLLMKAHSEASLASVIRFFKARTAKLANKALSGSGRFWFPEFFDRYICDSDHLNKVIRYIDENPVRAGLVKLPQEWRFSSAGYQK